MQIADTGLLAAGSFRVWLPVYSAVKSTGSTVECGDLDRPTTWLVGMGDGHEP